MDSRSRQSATRRRSPPERVPTSASPGGRRSASMAISKVRSSSQAPAASIFDWRSACSVSSASMSASGSPKAAHTSLNRSTNLLCLADALGHVAGDVLRRVELRLLGQVAHREPRREARLAGEPVVLARHDPQQRGLARTVRPDDTDLGARVEGQVDALENFTVRRIEALQAAHGVDELGRHGDQCAPWPPGPETDRLETAAAWPVATGPWTSGSGSGGARSTLPVSTNQRAESSSASAAGRGA